MILDKRNMFGEEVVLSTAGTGRALVGDVIPLGNNPANLGVGEDLYLVILVSTAVTSAGAATVSFELVSDAQAAIATDGSATVHVATADIPKATLVAGYQAIAVKLPAGEYENYLGLIQNVGTAALTAGAVTAFLTHDISAWKAYADAVN